MRPYDLLKNMDLADPAYVEEASDRSLLVYRKRRKRTRTVVAACLVLAVLAGGVFTEPAVSAWNLRNTVVSWPSSVLPGASVEPSSGVYVSAEIPTREKMDADQPFTLSVGLGQGASYEYATLSIKAPGFEITDPKGNTVTDRYVRTLMDFGGGDYGMLRGNVNRGCYMGCAYLEDFTFRYVEGEDSVEQGGIHISLTHRGEDSAMGDAVTVYYSVEDGVLKLIDTPPADGGGHAVLEEETHPGDVTLSKEDISVQVSMENVLLTHRMRVDKPRIHAFFPALGEDYTEGRFTAELVYAETARAEDYSLYIAKPNKPTEESAVLSVYSSIPLEAPVGAYDLRITDLETGFVWLFENMVLVVPSALHPNGDGFPAKEDLICKAMAAKPCLKQGEYLVGEDFSIFDISVQHKNGEDRTWNCTAWLTDTPLGYKDKDFVVKESALSSMTPHYYIPVDMPAGYYDLVVRDDFMGHTWVFEDFIEIIEDPDAERFDFYHDINGVLTVSRSSWETYSIFTSVHYRGQNRELVQDESFVPEASLVMQTNHSGWIPSIGLKRIGEPESWTLSGSCKYELEITPDTPCGLYDLVLSYGDCTRVFEGVVEVVP